VPRPSDFLGEETIGTSAQGRPITVVHRGTPGGAVVLVVGVIHGDEDAALPIVDRLAVMPLPPGIDLWLMPMMNPDGQANRVRGNGNGVDLNRNFPYDWQPISQPGDWQYSGTGPASEPETSAFVAFASRIHPALTLWYHQDLNIISPTKGRDGPLREKYAQLTGMPMGGISGGIYHGVAGGWIVHRVPHAMSFIIELGPTLAPDQVQVHADAVVTIALMVH
jgi:protein MpaA